MRHHDVKIPADKVAELCRRHHIRKFCVFGSVLRDDFRPDSDVEKDLPPSNCGSWAKRH